MNVLTSLQVWILKHGPCNKVWLTVCSSLSVQCISLHVLGKLLSMALSFAHWTLAPDTMFVPIYCYDNHLAHTHSWLLIYLPCQILFRHFEELNLGNSNSHALKFELTTCLGVLLGFTTYTKSFHLPTHFWFLKKSVTWVEVGGFLVKDGRWFNISLEL